MEFETLTVAIEEGIGKLTLNQPKKLNPLGTKTLQEISEATKWFDKQNTPVVIITGEGRAFSAGFDLREFANGSQDGRNGAALGKQMADSIENMNAVAIAAIHGHCIGGGVVLVGACDLRIAATNTTFSIPEVDLGIPLAWGGIPRLVREIGPAMTRELVMTCRPFSAEEAKKIGFLNRVVGTKDLGEEATKLAIAVQKRPQSVIQTTKRQIHSAAENLASTQNAWIGEVLISAAGLDGDAAKSAQKYLEEKNEN
ncbi:MAG: enoyl-CoA hydratase/isomerase family protein [Acidimicrobiales bacterium]|jgi:enoyl-CoA hydratase/carnithine racemase|nr:enoyl-CoA hydratase/isomerase family protein [Acidimicrobiales bacterium]MDP6299013.1 enoyl-CoA hydratase/isomerase family protein [Acidimicrobiales bacterium]HJM27515.1 enoyl-CoA hydratase/isomerase family protein [Acidimicrobiales bacterium]HJM97905.1 enoyl-CoA hydratase/isomerase family protein [Acidimicrobiales bacterium]